MNTTTKPTTQTSLYPDTVVIKSDNLAEVQINYSSKVKPSERIKVVNSREVSEVLRSVWSDKIEYVEEFAILLLNRANKVLGWAKISSGGTAACLVDAKIVFQLALNANATAIILCLNHPSGNLTPSQEDINMTKKIKEGAKLLDMQVIDHIILTPESYYSLADNGII